MNITVLNGQVGELGLGAGGRKNGGKLEQLLAVCTFWYTGHTAEFQIKKKIRETKIPNNYYNLSSMDGTIKRPLYTISILKPKTVM